MRCELYFLEFRHWEKTNSYVCVLLRHNIIMRGFLGLHHSVNEICAILEFYPAPNGSVVPTGCDNLSVSHSGVNQSKTPCP